MRQIKKKILFLILLACYSSGGYAQDFTLAEKPVYHVNWKWELPLTGVLFATDFIGLAYVGQLPGPDSLTAVSYNPADVWGFDRSAIFQDPDKINRNNFISDWILNFSTVSPAILALDPEIRKDWFELLVFYGETHAINGNIYVAAASLTEKARPLVYNDEIEFSEKLETGTLNSFLAAMCQQQPPQLFLRPKYIAITIPSWALKSTGFMPPHSFLHLWWDCIGTKP